MVLGDGLEWWSEEGLWMEPVAGREMDCRRQYWSDAVGLAGSVIQHYSN